MCRWVCITRQIDSVTFLLLYAIIQCRLVPIPDKIHMWYMYLQGSN